MAVKAPVADPDSTAHRRSLATVINGVLDGRTNNAGTVTLTQSATTTAVTDYRAGIDSVIVFCPLTASAATAHGTMWISSRGKQTFTITHANTADADKTFDYAVLASGRTAG